MRSRPLVFLLPMGLCCLPASAQLDWRQSSPGQSPPARDRSAIAWDHASYGLLLFGGFSQASTGTTVLNDTWLWRGGAWLPVSPALGPSARSGHGLASDPVRSRIVLYGGMDAGRNALADTWEWDGSIWTGMTPWLTPPARSEHAMTFDAGRNRVLVFGGADVRTFTVHADTWEWDGNQWTLRVPAMQPPATNGEPMVYDAARDRVVLAHASQGGTWEWDGTNWTRINANAPPSYGCAMVYDAARERVVRHGGADNNVPNPVGVWDYDGSAWVQRSTATPQSLRWFTALGFDPVTASVVNFGGRMLPLVSSNETWMLAPVNPAVVSAFGSGCAGSNGLLQISAQNRPWLGDSFRLRWSGLASASPLVALALGGSNQSWNGAGLPQTLAVLGMTGCSLHVSLDAITISTLTASPPVTALQVPVNASLLGSSVFLQGFAFDPGANPGGMSASNGIAARIGAR